jgi:hypothetical protein
MTLFQKAKIKSDKKDCYQCGSKFKPDNRNLKRGWGLFCSKSCSSKFREKEKTLSEIRDYRLKKLGI